MKKELVKLLLIIFIIVWGVAVSYFFPLLHLGLTWLALSVVTILVIKYFDKIYLDIFYNFALILINDRLSLTFADVNIDDHGRGLLLASFYLTSLIVTLIWGITLFTKVKKIKALNNKAVLCFYLPYLLIVAIVFTCMYKFILF
jgi:hypothetical protein